VRLRDLALPLLGTARMDINYILGREQVSLFRATAAASAPARIAHEGMAAAYGRLLVENGFPHRSSERLSFRPGPSNDGERWEDDGGPIETEHAVLVPSKLADKALVWSTPAPAGPSKFKKAWS
jgi:hypothetical protein